MTDWEAVALQYHLVTVTKYRTPVPSPAILRRFRTLARDIADDYGCEVSDINVDLDHAHLLFRAEPDIDLSQFVGHFKSATSKTLRDEFPGLKRQLSDALWQPGYFLCTTGQVTLDDLKEDVENQ
ncbi:IS200/IS605 family transposase [Halorussus ruber]|uniref:IS200/IS605 family transposase n=1 Tax=Halorussus ruber TaxID=1126238 RepID=UPI00109212FD|nr:IS200/IS605 family transposase [Halorussus ruber]